MKNIWFNVYFNEDNDCVTLVRTKSEPSSDGYFGRIGNTSYSHCVTVEDEDDIDVLRDAIIGYIGDMWRFHRLSHDFAIY